MGVSVKNVFTFYARPFSAASGAYPKEIFGERGNQTANLIQYENQIKI